jgi:hypothetical protein
MLKAGALSMKMEMPKSLAAMAPALIAMPAFAASSDVRHPSYAIRHTPYVIRHTSYLIRLRAYRYAPHYVYNLYVYNLASRAWRHPPLISLYFPPILTSTPILTPTPIPTRIRAGHDQHAPCRP